MKIAEQYELLMSQIKRDDLEFAKQCECQCSHVYIAICHGTVEATNVRPSYKHKYFGDGRICPVDKNQEYYNVQETTKQSR